MNASCLIKTNSVETKVKNLAATLAYGSASPENLENLDKMEPLEYNRYSNLAYFMICYNQGESMENTVDMNGKVIPDDTYNNLLNSFGGDVRAAIFAKAHSFTNEYEQYKRLATTTSSNEWDNIINSIKKSCGIDDIAKFKDIFGNSDYVEKHAKQADELLDELSLHSMYSNKEAQEEFYAMVDRIVQENISNDDVQARATEISSNMCEEIGYDSLPDADKTAVLNAVNEASLQEAKRELALRYLRDKRRECITMFRDDLAKLWGFQLLSNGTYGDSSVDTSNLNSNQKTAMQFRINVLNMLSTIIDSEDNIVDSEHFNLVKQIIECIDNGDTTTATLKYCMKGIIELYKGTAVYDQLLGTTGVLKLDQNGLVTQASRSKAERKLNDSIDKDFDFLYKDDSTSYLMYKGLVYLGQFLIKQLSNAKLVSLLSTLSFASVALYNIITQDGSFSEELAQFFTNSMMYTPLFTASSFVAKLVQNVFKFNDNSLKQTVTMHSAMKKLFMASALNKKIQSVSEDNTYTNVIRHVIQDKNMNINEKLLKIITQNLFTQQKALDYAKKHGNISMQQASDLNRIQDALRWCQAASQYMNMENMSSEDRSRGEDAFNALVDFYFRNYIINSTNESIRRLEEMKIDGNIDINEVMRIKTDVVGAFNSILQYINEKQVYNQLKKSNLDFFTKDVNRSARKQIYNNINKLKDLITNCVDEYCDSYLDNILENTFKDTIDDEHQYSLAKRNLKTQLRNAISSNNLGMVERFIQTANSSSSMLIRALVFDLQQVETEMLNEMNEFSGQLNSALNSSSKIKKYWSQIIFKNRFRKYIETTKSGIYTTFLKSDVKLGQYLEDYAEIKDIFQKRFDITEDSGFDLQNNDPDVAEKTEEFVINGLNWSDFVPGVDRVIISNKKIGLQGNTMYITKWQAYKLAITIWQAGGDYIDDELHYDKDKSIPRIITRKNTQYKIIKYASLTKNDINYLNDINNQLGQLYQQCQEEIEIDGKKVKYPNVAKLSQSQRGLYEKLTKLKKQMSSICSIDQTVDEKEVLNVIGLYNKEGVDYETAVRFYNWKKLQNVAYNDETYKKQIQIYYYRRGIVKEGTEEFKNAQNVAIEQRNSSSLFKAIVAEYEAKIKDARERNDLETESILKEELQYFRNQNSVFTTSNEIRSLFEPINKNDLPEKTIYRNTLDIIKNTCRTSDSRQFDYSRLIVYDDEGNIDKDKTRRIWNQIFELIENDNKTKESVEGVQNNNQFIDSKLIDINGTSIITFLTNNQNGLFRYSEIRGKISKDGKLHSFFYKYVVDTDALKESQLGNFLSKDEKIADYMPSGIFSKGTDVYSDDMYDEENEDNIQINKNRPEYDNSKEYEELKKDPVYNTLLKMLEKSFENYGTYNRQSKYQLPQMQDDLSSIAGRVFIQGIRNIKRNLKMLYNRLIQPLHLFDTRDTDVNQVDALTKADGTPIDIIPSRYVDKLKDQNEISTDLPYLIAAHLQESFRFKARMKKQAIFDAFVFKMSGGYSRSSDSISNNTVSLLQHNIHKFLYGRTVTGSGVNETLKPNERVLSKLTNSLRGLLFNRLMVNNDMSVFKNGTDSFCNLLTAGIDQRFYSLSNLRHALFNLGKNIISAFFSISNFRAYNTTQGLMHLNGLVKPPANYYKDLGKNKVTRILSNFAGTFKLELIDYTSKALITESVYDNYRLIKLNGKLGFYNLQEVLRASKNGSEDAYKQWSRNYKCTLRDAYKFDKEEGKCIIKDEYKQYISKEFQTKVRLHITKAASYINGMLDTMDKPAIATNYVGCLITSYRSWMISQYSANQMQGSDFYNNPDDEYKVENPGIFDSVTELFHKHRVSTVENRKYQGVMDFTNGYIGTGFTVDQNYTLVRNLWQVILGIICPYMLSINKLRRDTFKDISEDEMQKITHACAGMHFFILSAMMTVYAQAMMMAAGGAGDDKKKKNKFSLEDELIPDYFWYKVWAISVANTVERFSQVNKLFFYVNLADIVTSITVAVSWFETMKHLGNLVFDDADELDKVVKNNTFSGYTNREKHLIYLAKGVGINVLPFLEIMQVLNWNGYLPEQFSNTDFRNYDLNYMKYHSKTPIRQSGRKYGEYAPIPTLDNALDAFGWNVLPTPQSSNSKGSSKPKFKATYSRDSGMGR